MKYFNYMYRTICPTLIFIFLFSPFLQAQYCGWGDYYNQRLKDPAFSAKITSMVEATKATAEKDGTLNEVSIPIIYHIVHKGTSVGNDDNILYQNVLDSWTRLNADFAGTGISFCLAERDEFGIQLEEPGVVRVDASGNAEYMANGIKIGAQVEYDVKGLGPQFSNHLYCNVWVVSELSGANTNGQIQGVGYMPNTTPASIDGIMMRHSVFSQSTNRVITHETGHYLGLFHTFTGDDPDYDGLNLDCPLDGNFPNGDGIGDTQPHVRSASGTCPSGVNSCFTGGMLEDISNNHMDYSAEWCRQNFTDGQATEMRNTVACHRKGLINSLGCEPGCDPLFFVDFTSNPEHPISNDGNGQNGELATFTVSGAFGKFEWYVDGEKQSSVNSSMDYTFDTPGDHVVCLVVDDGFCKIETCKTIRVYLGGLCYDPVLDPCELLLNGDFSQYNELETYPAGTQFPGQFIDYETDPQPHTDKVCNWVEKGGTPTLAKQSNDDLAFYLSAFEEESTQGNNHDIISTISPLGLVDGASYTISFDWKAWRGSSAPNWATQLKFNVGLAVDPFIFDDKKEVLSEIVPLVLSSSTDPTNFSQYEATFTYDATLGQHLSFWAYKVDDDNGDNSNTALFQIKNISVSPCNVCTADPIFEWEEEFCGQVSFNGQDMNATLGGEPYWTINGSTVENSLGSFDLDFEFAMAGTFEVCLHVSCPYAGTSEYCETIVIEEIFIDDNGNEVECDYCRSGANVYEVKALRCGVNATEFLVESFTFDVPNGFGPCLDDEFLSYSDDGEIYVNSYVIDTSDPMDDYITVSFTMITNNPNTSTFRGTFSVCDEDGNSICIVFDVTDSSTCVDCLADQSIVQSLEVDCIDNDNSDGTFTYGGTVDIELPEGEYTSCGSMSQTAGLAIDDIDPTGDNTFSIDYTITTNQLGTFNASTTLCFINETGNQVCFTITIPIDEPCVPEEEEPCDLELQLGPLECDNVQDDKANFTVVAGANASDLINAGFVFCDVDPVTGAHVSNELFAPFENPGAYVFGIQLSVSCDEVKNDGATTIYLNLCHPTTGESACIEIEILLTCELCVPEEPCDVEHSLGPITCDDVKEDEATFTVVAGAHASDLINAGFVFCDDNPVTGDDISAEILEPFENPGAYIYGIELSVSCEDVRNRGYTTITLNLCNPLTGETACISIEIQLECDACDSFGAPPKRKIETATRYNVFPNPTYDEINVEIVNYKAPASYRLFNATGKEVLKGTFNTENNAIDVSRLGQGIYFIELSQDDNRTVQKIIKLD